MAVMGVDLAAQVRALVASRLEKLAAGTLWDVERTFPLVKVDEGSRMVEGVATSADLDSHGEILEYEGSRAALQNWAGNVREMHQPKAIGRAVKVEFDDANRRVVVRAFISRGAQDTMEKVLDGTLSMFSVGGTRQRSSVRKDGTRVTTAWTMEELSLVDSGANPACRVALVKLAGGVPVETGELGAPALPLAELDAMYARVAEAIRKSDAEGRVQTSGEYKDLTANLFRLAALRREARAAGAVRKSAPALPLAELVQMELRLAAELKRLNASGASRTSKEYVELSKTYLVVSDLVKRAARRAGR